MFSAFFALAFLASTLVHVQAQAPVGAPCKAGQKPYCTGIYGLQCEGDTHGNLVWHAEIICPARESCYFDSYGDFACK